MKNMTASTILRTATLLAVAQCAAAADKLPAGWIKAGSRPQAYEMGIDETTRREGKASAFVRSKQADVEGFGTLMQMSDPGSFRGKRVRFSGHAKSEKVKGWAGFWMRVDGDSKSRRDILAFDNMQQRPIEGTTDWKRYEIVLDVAQEAGALAFGVLLHGEGQVWVDDLNFEVVSADVPVTGTPAVPAPPKNLDFETK